MSPDYHEKLDEAVRRNPSKSTDYTEMLKNFKDMYQTYGSYNEWLIEIMSVPYELTGRPKKPKSRRELTEKQKKWLQSVEDSPHPSLTEMQLGVLHGVIERGSYYDDERQTLLDIRKVYEKDRNNR